MFCLKRNWKNSSIPRYARMGAVMQCWFCNQVGKGRGRGQLVERETSHQILPLLPGLSHAHRGDTQKLPQALRWSQRHMAEIEQKWAESLALCCIGTLIKAEKVTLNACASNAEHGPRDIDRVFSGQTCLAESAWVAGFSSTSCPCDSRAMRHHLTRNIFSNYGRGGLIAILTSP